MAGKKGKLFVVSAPSGAGKTTIIKRILNERGDLTFSVSATTRKRRDNETDGKDYFFITEKDFLEKIKEKEFIEWETFYDNYYGTLKSHVNGKLDEGKNIMLELDVKGAVSIKKEYPDSVLIFIMPPDVNELRKRLIERNTEATEELRKRMDRHDMELGYADRFDYIVINREVDKAVMEVNEIIDKEQKGE